MNIKLKKELTLVNVFSINAGAMMSSGLFVLPGLAYGISGPAMVISYKSVNKGLKVCAVVMRLSLHIVVASVLKQTDALQDQNLPPLA